MNETMPYSNMRIHKQTSHMNEDVCVLVSFSPDGTLRPAAYEYYQQLLKNNIAVVVCLVTNDIQTPAVDPRLGDAAAVIYRLNSGWDFAAWADVLRAMPELWQVKRLYFANDSMFCLPNNFSDTITKIKASDADYIALTECDQIRHHAQSYFFVLQNQALSDLKIHDFWNNVIALQDKADVIKAYETVFLNVVKEAGLSFDILFSYEKLFPNIDTQDLRLLNPTYHLWETLVYNGFPFIKVALLTRNPLKKPIYHWMHVAEKYGANVSVYAQHVDAVKAYGSKFSWSFLSLQKLARIVYESRITNKKQHVIRILRIPVYRKTVT